MMVQDCFVADEMKEIAYRLASILSSSDVSEEEARPLIAKLGYKNSPYPEKDRQEKPEATDHVGIYKCEIVDGKRRYVRDAQMKDRWSFCADIQTIEEKGEKKRVVLLGESVARGFLLDPDYTPALVLEALLKKCNDIPDVEVIDLAETNLIMAGLLKRFFECLALEPDAIVFLAGNNWRADVMGYISENQECIHTVIKAVGEEGSISGAKTIVEDVFRELVASFVRTVSTTAKARNVPVLIVIPEFNLLDWQSTSAERFVTRLSNSEIREWVFCEAAVEQALLENDFANAEKSAMRMIELDPSHPLGFEFMARSKVRQQLFDDARFFLEEARDTAMFCRTGSKPRIFKVIRDTILREAPIHGVNIIDLPLVMKDYLNGGIPGRGLFLDYCHFTMEGIQIVADAMCESLVGILTGQRTPPPARANSIKVKQERVGLSHLFAAIHNAHWGQTGEILRYHCLKAAKSSKEIQKVMIYYIDMTCREAPNSICKSFRDLMTFERMDKYIYALVHPKNFKSMEVDLVEAMSTALRQVGLDVKKYIKDLRIAEHSVSERNINLLNSVYHVTCLDKYLGAETSYFHARLRKSAFLLIAGKMQPVNLRLTLRIPSASCRYCEVVFLINNRNFASLTANGDWKDFQIKIPGDMLNEGVNNLLILWPLPPEDPDATLTRFVLNSRTDDGGAILDQAYYVFGEIHSFVATI